MSIRFRAHRFTGAALAVVATAALIGCSSPATPEPASKATVVVTSTPAAAATATAVAAATATAAAVATPAGPAALTVAQVSGASTLVEAKGLTLYTFKNDTAGKSACNGTCATNWPPVLTNGTPTKGTGISGDLGTIKRDDGSTQVTYKGAPLYRFAADTAAGDAKGAAIANWAVALP